jgi:hypothetical protein
VAEKSLDAGVANHIKGGIEVIPELQADPQSQPNPVEEGTSNSHPIILTDNSIKVHSALLRGSPLFMDSLALQSTNTTVVPASSELTKSRRLECKIVVAIDSIRKKSFLGLPPLTPDPLPDNKAPPTFNPVASGTTTNGANPSDALASEDQTPAAAKTLALPPAPASPTKLPPFDVQVPLTQLAEATRMCFLCPQSILIAQYSYNHKCDRMTSLANERKTDETAKATIEYITKNFEEASSKTVDEVVKEGVTRGNVENKRKIQSLEDSHNSLQDQIKESQAKLRKAELELKKLRSQVSNPNPNGGPAKGALEKNQTGEDNEKSVAFEDSPAKRRRRRVKQKKQRNQGQAKAAEVGDVSGSGPPSNSKQSSKTSQGRHHNKVYVRDPTKQR